MTQPTAYAIQTDFSNEEASNVTGRSTVRTSALDAEFTNLSTTIGQIIANLAIIQRDDTDLYDGIVTIASLSAEVLELLSSSVFAVRGNWVTSTAYVVGDLVRNGSGTYFCLTAHTSGTFATDLAALKWATLYDTTAYTATGISFTPTGTIAATNVQTAIAEAASEAMQKSSNLSDVANAATARTNIDAQQDVFTTRGDLVRAGASGVAERVALGTAGQTLRSDATDAVWAAPASAQTAGYNIAARTNSGTPNSKIDITADELIVTNSTGGKKRLTSVSVTIDIAVEGALGFDNLSADAEDASTWYYGWIFAKEDGTTTGILSKATALASVVLSHASMSGYTYGALVTAVYNNGSSNFLAYQQSGFNVTYTSQRAYLSGGAATSYTSCGTLKGNSGVIPSIATMVDVEMFSPGVSTGAGSVALVGYLGIASGSYCMFTDAQTVADGAGYSLSDCTGGRIAAVDPLYYQNAATNLSSFSTSVYITGFVLPGGGQ